MPLKSRGLVLILVAMRQHYYSGGKSFHGMQPAAAWAVQRLNGSGRRYAFDVVQPPRAVLGY